MGSTHFRLFLRLVTLLDRKALDSLLAEAENDVRFK